MDEEERAGGADRGGDEPSDPWELTIADTHAMAEDLESEGWETLVILAGHTHALRRSSGPDDRFGLVYLIPDDAAEEFDEAAAERNFPRYRVFQNRSGGRVFQVTQLLDPDAGLAVLLVGNCPAEEFGAVLRDAADAGVMYTHVRTLDESVQWTIQHDDHEGFLLDDEADGSD